MRFLVDESSGSSVAQALSDAGHDVVDITKASPQAADDVILQRALGENRTLVTNDKDFGDLVFLQQKPHAGIILFRLDDESAANRIVQIQKVLDHWIPSWQGKFLVVTEAKIRVRQV